MSDAGNDATSTLVPGGALDPQTLARAQGYSWQDIGDYVAGAANTALQNGYTQGDVDQHLGYQDPSNFQARARSSWSSAMAADPKILDGIAAPQPELDLTQSPTLATDYASAVLGREVKGAGDFVAHYADAALNASNILGPLPAVNVTDVAAQLPPARDFTDGALAVAPLDLHDMAKRNLLDHWAGTGEHPIDAAARAPGDPMLMDKLHDPSLPDMTMEAYQDALRNYQALVDPTGLIASGANKSAQDIQAMFKRDNPQFFASTIYDPMGNTYTDPTGLVGTAKAIYNSPADQLAWRAKMEELRARGASQAEIDEEDRKNPALNLVGNMLFGTLMGKAGGFAMRAARGTGEGEAAVTGDPQAPYRDAVQQDIEKVNGGTLGALWRDERDTVEVNPPTAAPEDLQKAVAALGTARGRGPTVPDELKPPELGDIKPLVTRLENETYKLRTNAVADKITLTKAIQQLPPEDLDAAFQRQVAEEVERRMIDTAAKFSPETEAFLGRVQALTDRQTELGRQIAEKTGDFNPENIRSVDEGYMHRVVLGGRQTPLDPDAQIGDVITGAKQNVFGGRTLSKFAPGMQRRAFYVLDDGKGSRIWGEPPLSELRSPDAPTRMLRFGDTIKTEGGETYTVKPATMEEAETHTDTRYQHNYLANTVENVARLERVNRNLDFLQNQAKELEDRGLFVRRSEEHPVAPEGWTRLEIPQMDGFAPTRIAEPLNDFFAPQRQDLEWSLSRANRLLMSSLFVSPVAHIANVGAHWQVARGWDWIRPRGYGSLIRDGARAVHQVWTLGPDYIEHMRNGSGLMYGSTQVENFYQTMMHKLFHEQLADANTWGPFARAFGFDKVADLVKAEYRWSRRSLWAVNDMFLLQRQFELERRGLSMDEAIRQSERDIPNYRIPSRVMGSRFLTQIMRSPNYMNFGRYKYGQIAAIARAVKDMIAGSNLERFEAVGKATLMAAMAMGAYPALNRGLQYVTGNPNASIRAAGPYSLIDSAYGLASGQKSWVAALASFFTFAPVLNLATMVARNEDMWGRKIIDGAASTKRQIIEALESGISTFYPGQLLLTAFKPGGVTTALGSLVNLKLSPGGNDALRLAYERKEAAQAQSRERKDAFENALLRLFGGAPADHIAKLGRPREYRSPTFSPPTQRALPRVERPASVSRPSRSFGEAFGAPRSTRNNAPRERRRTFGEAFGQ